MARYIFSDSYAATVLPIIREILPISHSPKSSEESHRIDQHPPHFDRSVERPSRAGSFICFFPKWRDPEFRLQPRKSSLRGWMTLPSPLGRTGPVRAM
jgi:hypothetical protein